MKKWIPIISMITLMLLVSGCSKKNGQPKIKIPKDAAKMGVSFSWDGIAACDHQSPEIRVTDVPATAVLFKVRLKNLDVPAWNQGGGEVANDGSGILPAGALQLGFNGPCPPPGERQKYEFSVMALDDQGRIVGFGKARHRFPPKD